MFVTITNSSSSYSSLIMEVVDPCSHYDLEQNSSENFCGQFSHSLTQILQLQILLSPYWTFFSFPTWRWILQKWGKGSNQINLQKFSVKSRGKKWSTKVIYVTNEVRNWIMLTLAGWSGHYPKVKGDVSQKLSEWTLPG